MMQLSTRLIRAPRLCQPPLHASKHAQLRLPSLSVRRPFPSSSSSSSNGSSSRAHLRFALIPLFLSSPLLLDDKKPSLSTINAAVEHPAASEFLIAHGTEPDSEDHSPTFFGRTFHLVRVYLLEPLSTAARFVHLAILFLPVMITSPVMFLEYMDVGRDKRRGYKKREGERRTTRWWYRLLVHQMERAGPTFIKLAQWAGSRTDLFPAELCILFGKLHSNGKPHSLRYTQRVISRAFGKPFDEVFLEFAEHPMGIGAIAQVYKAVLNPDILPSDYLIDPKHVEDPAATARITRTLVPSPDDKKPAHAPNAEVAIKVLHPGVEKMIGRDLKIMMFFARVLNSFPGMEWLSFPEEVQVFGQMMMSQVDLRIEANNLQTFEDNFKHRPTVSFPRALKKYTSRGVLVEEFEDAVPLEAFLQQAGGAFDHRLANLGLDAFLHMLLIDDFSHADLHPGNIMVKFFKPTTKSMLSTLLPSLFGEPARESAGTPTDIEIVHHIRSLKHDRPAFLAALAQLDKEGYQPELVFIDAGLVTRLDGQNRQNFLELFGAVTRFDGYEAGRLMVERCRAPELVIDEEEFALRMQHLVLSVKSQTFSLAQIRIADVLSEVLNNVRRHHVKMEADFVNTVLSILLLEGIGRQLDPEMDLFKSAVPILRQLGKQVGADQVLKQAGSIDAQSLGTMLKVWVWIEARQMASIASEYVDELVRYDYLTPNV